MSWQAYIDTSLVGAGTVDKAAIISAAGDSVWAASAGFNLSADEMKVIAGSFTNAETVQTNGFKASGEKFTFISLSDRTLRGKKGKEGILCVKTQQAIIIAHHPESVQTQQTSGTVEALADYLVGVGY